MTTAPIDATPQPASTGSTTGSTLTGFGITIAVLALLLAGTTASGSARKAINLFLGVILVGIVILQWPKIGPLFIKGGASS